MSETLAPVGDYLPDDDGEGGKLELSNHPDDNDEAMPKASNFPGVVVKLIS